ncbi:MAG: SDR family oxidoreductase [Chitinophagales bacterium]
MLENKVVWVTGASSGIGEALAYELNKLGAKLILSARRVKELKRVSDNCINKASPIHILPLDLVAHDTFEEKAQQALQLFGGIDILINNGGVACRMPASKTTLDIDKRVMNINYFGNIALTKTLLPHFTAKKAGHIVTVSSLTGHYGTQLRSSYAASKHALHGFYESLRSEVWKDNIKVTIACPGFVSTQILKQTITTSENNEQYMQANNPRISAQDCAKIMVNAIIKGKEEVFVFASFRERASILIKHWFPSLFSYFIKRIDVG